MNSNPSSTRTRGPASAKLPLSVQRFLKASILAGAAALGLSGCLISEKDADKKPPIRIGADIGFLFTLTSDYKTGS